MKQTRVNNNDIIHREFPHKRNKFKKDVKTKIEKWNMGREGAHELGLRRIARQRRVGINYETINKIIKPKYSDDTIHYLDETYIGGCVIILNNEDYLNLDENDNIDHNIKEHLGSNDNVSSIIFINDFESYEKLKPIINSEDWSELIKNENINLGNEHWQGQYAVVIRGGIQNPIVKGKIELFNMDFDFTSIEYKEQIEAQMTYLLLKSENPEQLLKDPSEYTNIEKDYREYCEEKDLLNKERLVELNIIDSDFNLICPICGKKITSNEILGKCERNNDVELTHLIPLTSGVINHRPYNLGLGCHMCNVFQGEFSISDTVERAKNIVEFHIKK